MKVMLKVNETFSAFFLITQHKYLLKYKKSLEPGPLENREAFFNLTCSGPHTTSYIHAFASFWRARDKGELLQIGIHVWNLWANI